MERRLLNLIAILALAALLTLRLEAGKETPQTRPAPAPLPAMAGGWAGARVALSQEELDILGAENVDFVRYSKSPGEDVGLCIVREGRRRAAFHPPEYCYLAQSDAAIAAKGRASIPVRGKRREASTMTLRHRDKTVLVLYWYRTGDYHTPSYYVHQLSFLWRIFRGGGDDSAMVRVTTRVGEKGPEGALKRMEGLLSAIEPHCEEL